MLTVTGGNCDLQWGGNDRGIGAERGRTKWFGHATATGASTLSGGTESGSGTTNAQGGAAFSSTGFALDGGRTLQLGGASTASGTSVQINLNGANPNTGLSDAGSGILTIANGATFNDQTTSTGLNILRPLTGGSDTGTTAAVNNAGTFTKSGSAATSTISHAVQQHRHRGRPERDAEPVRRRDGCRGDLPRRWDSQLQRWHADAGQQFEHHGKCDLQRRSDDGQWRRWHRLADGHRRNCDLQWGGNDRCIGAERRRTKRFGHADGDGRVDVCRAGRRAVLGRRMRRVERRLAARGLGSTADARCSWAAPARRRDDCSDQPERRQSEHRRERCGVRHPDDRERCDVQRSDDEFWTDHLTASQSAAATPGTTAAVNNAGTFTKSGSAATSTISHAVQQHRHRERAERDAEPVRRRHRCRGDLQRRRHGQLQRWHPDAGRHIEHHGQCDLQRRADDGQRRQPAPAY